MKKISISRKIFLFLKKVYNFFQEAYQERQRFFDEMTPEERIQYWEDEIDLLLLFGVSIR